MRGIDGIVMDRDPGVPAARRAQLLAQHRPLPDIQVERGGQHEEDRGLVADTSIDHPAEMVLARVFRRSCREAGEIDPGRHPEGALRERLEGRRLGFCTGPGRLPRPKVGREDEDGSRHGPPAQIFSRPPMRLFLTITAIMSTMSRAPSRDVMSAMS